ncbi:hypothetical protein IFM89_038166 [Coptis chinensis]|uniref:O-acyltransferase WSD1 C-terminal domain-containing protein n=1 Tax=Coptis chinensis TaxID=261450 RepID=A0A835HQG5_9MAGN|nr:hypothetical protein IFM89_038166 [Coptis chinensis]
MTISDFLYNLTVNDVVTGLIYYMIHLYMLRKGDTCGGKDMNLLVMFNMRMLGGYKNIAEMMKANIWGNHVAFLHAPIPNINGEEKIDPLYFINKGKEIMDRKKNSLFVFLTNSIIKVLRYLKGPKGVADYVHSNFKNTTTTVTSLIGPKEKLTLGGHRVGSSYFIVAGIPQVSSNFSNFNNNLESVIDAIKLFMYPGLSDGLIFSLKKTKYEKQKRK